MTDVGPLAGLSECRFNQSISQSGDPSFKRKFDQNLEKNTTHVIVDTVNQTAKPQIAEVRLALVEAEKNENPRDRTYTSVPNLAFCSKEMSNVVHAIMDNVPPKT
ncbi:hypothetical protein FGIG_01704 [Fasciola gigantica]|uniref:Uncharacterized protein n=1 Tax=Fasciola gigantica TaxID=46835 RepID=A0A504YTK6_FASGI|nr:hypothetical protein FGIG_01704 [Fasciola gigantica]